MQSVHKSVGLQYQITILVRLSLRDTCSVTHITLVAETDWIIILCTKAVSAKIVHGSRMDSTSL